MLRLVFGHLLQKKFRTSLTLAGIAVATGTLFTLLAFQTGYRKGLESELSSLGAHILVVPKGCPYDSASLALHGANWPCYLKESYYSQVAQTAGIAVAAPVLMAASHGSDREVISGITPDYQKLRPHWRIEGRFPNGPNEVLIGATVADRAGLMPGAILPSRLLKRDLQVSGVLQPTSGPDDEFMFIGLATAQEALTQHGHLTHVLVKLSSPDRLESVVQALRGCDAGMQMNIVPLAHLFETIRAVSSSATYLLAGLAAIGFLVGGTALANTMLMAVLERTGQIGVMRAIGGSRAQIFRLFLIESLSIGGLGAFTGLLLSFSGSKLIEGWVRGQVSYAPKGSLLLIDPATVGIALTFALCVSVLAGVLPAWRAARLSPTEAFRAGAKF